MATRTKSTQKPAQKKMTINDLAIMVQNGFASLHSEMDMQFDTIDSRFDSLETHINKRFDALENRFDAIQGIVVNEHGNRLNAIESDVLKIKVSLQSK